MPRYATAVPRYLSRYPHFFFASGLRSRNGVGDLPDRERDEAQHDDPQQQHAHGCVLDLRHRAGLIGLAAAPAGHERDRDHADHDVQDAEHQEPDPGDRAENSRILGRARGGLTGMLIPGA